ncbi:uncharacterized protein LOC128243819 [Mya arenaria]|nr:uncharacterized protein LOC128243819 [Mya arenaria]
MTMTTVLKVATGAGLCAASILQLAALAVRGWLSFRFRSTCATLEQDYGLWSVYQCTNFTAAPGSNLTMECNTATYRELVTENKPENTTNGDIFRWSIEIGDRLPDHNFHFSKVELGFSYLEVIAFQLEALVAVLASFGALCVVLFVVLDRDRRVKQTRIHTVFLLVVAQAFCVISGALILVPVYRFGQLSARLSPSPLIHTDTPVGVVIASISCALLILCAALLFCIACTLYSCRSKPDLPEDDYTDMCASSSTDQLTNTNI